MKEKACDAIFSTHFDKVCRERQKWNMENGFRVAKVEWNHTFGSNVSAIAKTCGVPERVLLEAQRIYSESRR